MENSTNISTEILERLVRLETKIDTFKTDISKCEQLSDNNKSEIIELKNKANNLENEVKEIKEKMQWLSRTTIGAIVTCVAGIVLAGLRVLMGI